MAQPKSYSSYPAWMILVSNLVSLATYAAGAFVISQIPMAGSVMLIIYLLFIFWLELNVMRKSCVNCYYFGKCCAFGKGRLAALFLRKGTSNGFTSRKIAWKDLLPDFLVSTVPILAGIILLILRFSWSILISIVLLLLLMSAGNGFIRGSLACKFCRQRELGCPAEQLFNKNGKASANKSPRKEIRNKKN